MPVLSNLIISKYDKLNKPSYDRDINLVFSPPLNNPINGLILLTNLSFQFGRKTYISKCLKFDIRGHVK